MTRLRRHDDNGVTLVELLITTVLMAVVGTILVSAVASSHRLFRISDAETTGQTDVRTTIERLGRDIRNARSLDPGATASELVLWIDSDSDYKKEAPELVTWRLVERAGDGQYDVTRIEDGRLSRTARLVISEIAFCYKATADDPCLATPLTAAQAESVRLITSSIEYDAVVDRGTDSRFADFTERLRNVK